MTAEDVSLRTDPVADDPGPTCPWSLFTRSLDPDPGSLTVRAGVGARSARDAFVGGGASPASGPPALARTSEALTPPRWRRADVDLAPGGAAVERVLLSRALSLDAKSTTRCARSPDPRLLAGPRRPSSIPSGRPGVRIESPAEASGVLVG